MPTITANEVRVPANVPADVRETYVENVLRITRGSGRLNLFAGDQKIEHLNDDFHGPGMPGCFAAQLGLVSAYGPDYPDINYLIKLNSKTHLVPTKQRDPLSLAINTVDDVLDVREASGLRIVGIGYTIYLGSEYEAQMMTEAAQLIHEAHNAGLLAILWIYPRGKAVENETDPHLIAGAGGTALCLGADYVKVSYPKVASGSAAEAFRETCVAAGRTGVIVSGGSSKDARRFLQDLHEQIHISGAAGNATGRNVHQ
jgi:fructose-bisphosphate aldolase/6-deoxy-5-ketofructose 1-phosphate synthase